MFKREFRNHGVIPLSTYMRCYKYGDYVDIVANGAIHKGMPFKGYHGRTGVVFDVTKTAVGVEVNKQVRNRIIKKRIHVKVDHIRPSKCRLQHLNRVKENDAIKRAKNAEKVCLKRVPLSLVLLTLLVLPSPSRLCTCFPTRSWLKDVSCWNWCYCVFV